MEIGIGLPNPIPGADGKTLVAWARRAEERGFAGLSTIDRIAYPSYESLISLAAAAGATERIGLMTCILLGPTRNPVLLAKEVASLDQLSAGRLTLGVAAGARQEDYDVLGLNFHDRGKRWDEALELIHAAWRGEHVAGSTQPVTPPPANGESVKLMIGGHTDAALRRIVKWDAGWAFGGGGAERAAPMIERVRQAWADAGKAGKPRIAGLMYGCIGAQPKAGAYLRDYYADFGEFAERIGSSVPTSAQALREAVQAHEAVGVDLLFIDPTIAEIEQVDMIADAVL